jgi:hypothetical protein
MLLHAPLSVVWIVEGKYQINELRERRRTLLSVLNRDQLRNFNVFVSKILFQVLSRILYSAEQIWTERWREMLTELMRLRSVRPVR